MTGSGSAYLVLLENLAECHSLGADETRQGAYLIAALHDVRLILGESALLLLGRSGAGGVGASLDEAMDLA